jgi:hypothetical protein
VKTAEGRPVNSTEEKKIGRGHKGGKGRENKIVHKTTLNPNRPK